MSEKLQQAIVSIKSGNKQEGQQLLAQILQTEPNNETAWLWMSAVVDEDKRKYCIERVLKINPNNEVAKQALNNLNSYKNINSSSEIVSTVDTLKKNKPTELVSQKVEAEEYDSILKVAIKDGVKTGGIFGIAVLPVILILIFLSLSIPSWENVFLLSLIIFMFFPGIYTGFIFFRKQIGANLSVSLAGGISGFIASAIWYLVIGFMLNYYFGSQISATRLLTLCGFTIPLIIGIINTITVWIPRIFINPNNPKRARAIQEAYLEKYWENKRNKVFENITPPVVLQEFQNDSKYKQRFWMSSENCVFFLEDKFLFGIIPQKSKSRFEESISNGNIDFGLLIKKSSFLYTSINEVTKKKSLIKIEWIDKDKSNYLEINFDNENETNVVFDEIHKHVSNNLEKSTNDLSTMETIKSPLIAIFVILFCSLATYFASSILQNNWVIRGESVALDQTLIVLFEILASGGVVIIGGIFFIVALGILFYRLSSPSITKLKIKQSIPEKLENAMHYIKSGNVQKGHRLLTQIVEAEPNNEEAWFWIASVSSENKKQIYLEKVLEINPNNQQALEVLEALKAREKLKQVETIQPKLEPTINSSSIESDFSPVVKKFWINPTRKELFVFLLSEDRLLTAKSQPKFTQELTKQLSAGNIPNLLTEKITVHFKNLIKIEESLNSVKIIFQDKNGHSETIRMECKDEQMSSEIFSAIEQRTHSLFERNTMPMSKGKIILNNSIVLSIILGLSAFLYFGALEIESGVLSPSGSARFRGIIALLDVIGASGVICIGGGLFLVVLFSMISSLRKPPLVTNLTRKEPIQTKSITNQLQEEGEQTPTNIQSPETKYSFLLSAALSDGLRTGLIWGILSTILPILFIILKADAILGLSLVTNMVIIFSVGLVTANRYYERKLPRGTRAVNIGGGLSGFITGGLCGLIYGFIFYIEELSGEPSQNQSGALFAFTILFFCSPALVSSIIGALMAGVPGLFIKKEPNIKDYDWRDGKSELEIARIENQQNRNKNELKSRLIFGGIVILLVFISAICRSLAN